MNKDLPSLDEVYRWAHGEADFGYYGQTGRFSVNRLPTKKCCGYKPVLQAHYDDTPGFRGSVYSLFCSCGRKTKTSDNIKNVIEEWNSG